MRYLIIAFCLLLLCPGCDVKHGSNEPMHTRDAVDTATVGDEWETYLAQYEGSAGSTIVNMSLKAKAPVSGYAYLLITGVKFTKCKDGLPTQDAFAGLYEVADSVEAVVSAEGKAIHAGTFTHECKRLDYYYVTDTIGLRAVLTHLYVQVFPGYEASIHIAEDKPWDGYLKFLYPNEATQHYIADERVIDNLIKNGDSLAVPRPIDYGIYFKTVEDREHFIAYALHEHFNVESKGNAAGAYPFELTISKVSPVDIAIINPTGEELRKQAVKYNGEYDGWGCGVVK